MFVKGGTTGYQAWDEDGADKPPPKEEDSLVGLIPCMAVLRTQKKPAVPVCEQEIRKHCTATLKVADGLTLRTKALRRHMLSCVDHRVRKEAKAAWPKTATAAQLQQLLGKLFSVDDKTVRLVEVAHAAATKNKKDKKKKIQKIQKEAQRKRKRKNASPRYEEEPLPKVNWKKHCKAVLADAPERQLKPKVRPKIRLLRCL